MKIALGTFEADDNLLKSIRRSQGQHGKATRDEAKAWAAAVLKNAESDTVSDYPPSQRPSKVLAVTE